MVITRIAKKILITVCCFILGMLLVIGTINYDQKMVFAQESNQLFSGAYSENSIIVVLDEDISEINKIHKKEFFEGIELESIVDLTWRENNTKSKNKDFRQILQLNLKEQNQVALSEIIGKISNIKGVKSVEHNYMVELDVVPNDSNFEDLWGLYGENGIDAVEAWGITIGHSDITVGIIDTGIANHPDLIANLKVGYDFYNDNTITSDDTNSHGTHVAGTIGAVGNNYTGIAGINWNVTLVALQAANAENTFYTSDVVDAIEWAEDQWGTNDQIDIINYSVSGFGVNESVLEAVRDFSGLFVWSAGNNETDIDEIIREDGFYDLSNLISVGAIKENGERANVNDWGYNKNGEPQGSNYSSSGENVNIYAPGHRIYSTVLNNNYANKSGTSMAAPHVSGVAALVLSINPNLNAQQVKNIILDSADNSIITLPDGTKQSVKTLNAFKAVGCIAFEMNSEGNCITGFNFNPTNSNIEIPSIINGVTITSIGANAFANQTQVTSITLPSTITNIEANAFSGCTNLTSINIPANVTSIGAGAFAGCSSLTNITIPAGVTSIGEGAFAGCSNLNISVSTSNPNYSAQGNILYNKAKTKIIGSGDISANITIPNTVTEVGVSAFSGNTNLQRVDIYGMPVIDDFAFYDCANLNEVYFYSYTVPEIGISSFSSNTFTLYVPHSKQSAYGTEFVGYTNTISSMPIVVTFMIDGETYQTLNTYYGANIIGLTNPYKEGYTFNYWEDDNSNTYQNGGVWDSTGNLTVEADWTARQSYINFSGYGTTGLTSKLVTYDQSIGTLPMPNSTGPVFIGWKDEYNVYYTADTIWQRTSNLTLIADYDGMEEGNSVLYTVILSKEGGNGGSDSVKAEYSAAMPNATKPTRTGYTFQGYYTGQNGTGEKYYNADMTSARNWDIPSDKTLYADWEGLPFTVTLKADNSMSAETIAVIDVKYGDPIPTNGLVKPTKTGYSFKGFYDDEYKQYIQPNLSGDVWDKLTDAILYAEWEQIEYTLTLDFGYGGIYETTAVKYNEIISFDSYGDQCVPNRTGYDFKGFYTGQNGTGKKYFEYDIIPEYLDYVYILENANNQKWVTAGNGTLYAYWTLIEGNYTYEISISNADEPLKSSSIYLKHGTNVTITAPTIDGYTFEKMWINGTYYTSSSVQFNNVQLKRNLGYGIDGIADSKPFYIWYLTYGSETNNGGLFMVYKKNECVAEGTLITLADGTRVPVESLTGNERLLVWNLHTGRFDTAPILFIDHDSAQIYKIINLYFSDGTHLKVISEHAFWDFDLNQYVFLRADAAKYIGHWFNKQTTDAMGNMVWTRVQLTSVTITEEYTTAWSPVTYGHLCIYVNGMLSMPGATSGLINIFEVDGETMQINQEQYLADIATYGLFTYEEFAELYPIPEEMFNAVNGQYLKVSIGKGLIDYKTLGNLIENYSYFFE